jgi:hypothetical protein
MTKGGLIDQVYLNVNGGTITEDAEVKWLDIANIVGAAYRKYLQSLIDSRNRLFQVLGVADFVDEGITTFEEVMPLCKDGRVYLQLTKRPVQLIRNLGIYRVSQGVEEFIKMSTPASVKGAEGIIPYYYWYQNPRVIVTNSVPDVRSAVTVQYIVDLDDLEEDDETNIPSGLELDIVNFCTQYFSAQNDSDKIIDNEQVSDPRQRSEGYMRGEQRPRSG